MKNLKAWFLSPKFKQDIFPEVKRLLAVIFYTSIYAVGVTWFLEASVVPLYTAGMPGIAQILRDFLFIRLKIDLGPSFQENFMGIIILLLNFPVMIIAWKGVSKKFALYTIVSILVQALVLGWIPPLNLGLGSEEHVLTAVFLGGVLSGIGGGGTLKHGTSTGGFDAIAQYFSLKKGKTVGFFLTILNLSIALVGGLILGGVELPSGATFGVGMIVSYTVIRIIITSMTTDLVHTSYQYVSVEIITATPKDLVEEFLKKSVRGVTLMKVEGAYSKNPKTLVYIIITAFELNHLLEIVYKNDPDAFIITRPVRNVFGNFVKRRIV
jgi:uncharacterized membrane-anchored protein YitT (DUF2179 family)